MSADGQKVLAAVLVAVFENVNRGPPLAADAEAFDVRVPDGLAGCKFGYGFEGDFADGQLATKYLLLGQNS